MPDFKMKSVCEAQVDCLPPITFLPESVRYVPMMSRNKISFTDFLLGFTDTKKYESRLTSSLTTRSSIIFYQDATEIFYVDSLLTELKCCSL